MAQVKLTLQNESSHKIFDEMSSWHRFTEQI